MRRRDAAVVLGLAFGSPIAAAFVVACGSRSGLPVPDPSGSGVTGGDDAGGGVSRADGSVPDLDASLDGLPLIDVIPPREASLSLCTDASATLIYVVTQSKALLRFDPTTSSFTTIGTLACPDDRAPFSMAVDHTGIAYVLYASGTQGDTRPGSVFRVSTANASCEATGFAPDSQLFPSFGMGFSADDQDLGETLYVASDALSSLLGTIDTTSFGLQEIAPFNPITQQPELTGTGDGRLFAFYTSPNGGSAIGQIDKTTATVIAETPLPDVTQGQAWAFGFWGGDFYLFTAPGGSSIVTRVGAGGVTTQVAAYPDFIVGAGVSTCAPAR